MLSYRKLFARRTEALEHTSGSSVMDAPAPMPNEFPDAAEAADEAAMMLQDIMDHTSEAMPEAAPPVPTPDQETPMRPVTRLDGLDQFDEAFYLRAHADVAEAVARGEWHDGLMHYAIAGRAKERVAAPDVDEAWYEVTYPMAQRDIAAGLADGPSDHYHRIGRYRGYLPFAAAPRPDNPARYRSRYGGLWTDLGNALDIVEGKLDLGMITPAQAGLLRQWVTEGYVVLPQAIPEDILNAAAMDLNLAYHGGIPDMRFAVHGVGQRVPWSKEALSNPAKALDLHWHSQAVRDLIFAPEILGFLHLIFERRALASQTLGFWRGSQQDGHQDSAYVNYSLPMQFAASWIALEDVVEGAGELFYHVGSHRISEFRFLHRLKGVEEASRLGLAGPDTERQIKEHIDRIALQAEGLGLRTERLIARRGDVLLWAADLAHGGSRISAERTRKSMVTHYCPADCVPSYFERSQSQICEGSNAYFSSSHYGQARQ